MAKETVKEAVETVKNNAKGGVVAPLTELSYAKMAELVKQLSDYSYTERRKIAKKYRGYKYHEEGKRIYGIAQMLRAHDGNQWILNYMIYAECGPGKRTQFKSKLLVAQCFTPDREEGLWLDPEMDEHSDIVYCPEEPYINDSNPELIERLKYSNLDTHFSLSIIKINHYNEYVRGCDDHYICYEKFRDMGPHCDDISHNIALVEAYLNFPQIEQFYRLENSELSDRLTRNLLESYKRAQRSGFEEKSVTEFRDLLAAVRLALKKNPLLYSKVKDHRDNNKYNNEFYLWWDTVKGYQILGKDIRNPKYYFFHEEELRNIHDKVIKKIDCIQTNSYANEIAKAELPVFLKLKGKYIGLEMTDGDIVIKTLSSPMEYIEESRAMHNCISAYKYYLKQNSLILCATKDRKRIADIELDLRDYKIIQCCGPCNRWVNMSLRTQIENLIRANHDEITRRKSRRSRTVKGQ